MSEWGKCPTEADGPEGGACRSAADCEFGSALNAAKKGFLDDVVSIETTWQKINYAAKLEIRYGERFPTSCNFLFEPPYQPEPYPHESYSYGYYQPEPYQRNPYQRNPYQRNPYQRNPYQRNTYQRNPYKRRN
ncbi:hypothetical protein AAVH_22814 [Aphelenchoides avenae]|nr:hypothetical protein AAVH_22814 [Aphelenchus avenae]